MIDAPVVQRAVKLVARARKMGIVADEPAVVEGGQL